jgi:hypothetical protein
VSTKRKKKFGETSERMEGFPSLISITGFSRLNTGKDNNDDDWYHA